jgi:uncharacterized protein YbaR (Trm112 family)
VFIELVDALRCPVPHEESWLVAAAQRMEARHIVEGVLGCPVCAAEYAIHDGVVDLRRAEGQSIPPSLPGDAEQAMRLAALLDLSDAQGFAVLLGDWGAHAQQLASIVELPIMLIDPPADVVGSPGISVLRSDGELPLAAGVARAMAIDGVGSARVASAVRATRAKGRVLAPVAVPLPVEVQELARDATLWVGERSPLTSPIVTLHVRRSS